MFLTALSLAFLPEPVLDRYAAAALFLNGEIYVAGGSAGREHSRVAQLDVFHPARNAWRKGPACPDPREFATPTHTGRHFALAGGLDAKGLPTNRFDLFDLVDGKWTAGPPMPIAVSRAAADVRGLDSVVTGGIESQGGKTVNSRAVQMFSRRLSQWRRGPDLPEGVHGHTLTLVGKTLFSIGGYAGEKMDRTKAVWSLTEGDMAWKARADMPEARGFHSSVAYRDRIFVFGNRGEAPHPLVYDPVADKWSEVKGEDLHRHRAAFAVAGSRAYFIGGEGSGPMMKVFDLKNGAWLHSDRF